MAIILHPDFSRPVQSAVKALFTRRQMILTLTKYLNTKTKTAPKTILSEKLAAFQEIQKQSQEKVRVCKLSEYKEVALSLAHAFADDPCALWYIETEDRKHWTAQQKWDLHVECMEYMVYAHMMDGLVTTIGKNYGAVALWMPPGKDMDSTYTTLRSGLWRLHYRLSRIGHKRFFNDFMPLLHDTKHDVLKERDTNSWYLVYLGTKPDSRRMGYARALLEDVIVKADADGLPMYLESSKEMNVPIYEKFGFDERARVWMGAEGEHDSVPLDIMVREPWSC